MLTEQLSNDPSTLKKIDCGWADFRNVVENHGDNFVIRMFAEFETGLREIWYKGFRKSTEPRTVDLLVSMATRRQVPLNTYEYADRVRSYRNALVHVTDEEVEPMTVAEVRAALCRFFSYMPDSW